MDCSYVNEIIEKYSKNGQLTQNEKTAYSNLSQTLNNWFNRTYNRYSYYPKMSIQQSGSRAKGTAIKAACAGTVTFAGWGTSAYSGYGNVVVVKSGSSVSIIYGHCSAVYVKTGQTVSQGQVIAAVGSTGLSTGNHLHFEIRYNGKAVNPQNYIYK